MVRQSIWKKRVGLIAVLLPLLGTVIAGCGNGGEAKGADSVENKMTNTAKETADTKPKPEVRHKISMMYNLYGTAPLKTEAWKFVEDKLNIDLELLAIPDNSYKEKVNVTIASGELPDLMLWHMYPGPEFSRLIEQNAILPLDDYLKDAPNFQNYPPELWETLKTDGKIYGIPRPRALNQSAVVIRKDWLDNLGLPVPKTTDEFFKTAVAFANDDPDGNGKNDTVGLVMAEKMGHTETLMNAFDSGFGFENGYRVVEDGTLLYERITPGRKNAVKWLRDLYASGGIDRDFATMKKTNVVDRMTSGKAGMELGASIPDFGKTDMYVDGVAKVDPKANFIIIEPPLGPTGKSGYSQTLGFFGQWVIPANTPEDKVKKMVELLDWMAGEEALKIKNYGIEGVHHTVAADGTITLNKEKYEKDAPNNVFVHNAYDPYIGINKNAPENVQKASKDAYDMIKGKLIVNPAATYLSPTAIEKKVSLDTALNETETRIIMGDLPFEAWDKMKEDYLKNGGEQIQKEVNEWYQANKK